MEFQPLSMTNLFYFGKLVSLNIQFPELIGHVKDSCPILCTLASEKPLSFSYLPGSNISKLLQKKPVQDGSEMYSLEIMVAYARDLDFRIPCPRLAPRGLGNPILETVV